MLAVKPIYIGTPMNELRESEELCVCTTCEGKCFDGAASGLPCAFSRDLACKFAWGPSYHSSTACPNLAWQKTSTKLL